MFKVVLLIGIRHWKSYTRAHIYPRICCLLSLANAVIENVQVSMLNTLSFCFCFFLFWILSINNSLNFLNLCSYFFDLSENIAYMFTLIVFWDLFHHLCVFSLLQQVSSQISAVFCMFSVFVITRRLTHMPAWSLRMRLLQWSTGLHSLSAMPILGLEFKDGKCSSVEWKKTCNTLQDKKPWMDSE